MDTKTSYDFSYANSQLTLLLRYPGQASDILPILEPMFTLKELYLTFAANFALAQLIVPLSHLPKLQVLSLAHFQDLTQGDKARDLPNLSITELCLDSERIKNPGQTHIVRYCPNPEIFKFYIYDEGSYWLYHVVAISDNLRK